MLSGLTAVYQNGYAEQPYNTHKCQQKLPPPPADLPQPLLLPAQLRDQDCFPAIIGVVCSATEQQTTEVRPFIPVLLNAADRCVNYQAPATITCPDGRLLETLTVTPIGTVAAAPAAEPPMPEMMMPDLAAVQTAGTAPLPGVYGGAP